MKIIHYEPSARPEGDLMKDLAGTSGKLKKRRRVGQIYIYVYIYIYIYLGYGMFN